MAKPLMNDGYWHKLDSLAVANNVALPSDRMWHAVDAYEALSKHLPNSADRMMVCLLREYYGCGNVA